MHILLLAATTFEIQPVISYLQDTGYRAGKHTVAVTVPGVGMVHTTYGLHKSIVHQRPDLIIQAGIAGSFNPAFTPGTVVIAEKDLPGDLGVEEHEAFKDVFDMGFQSANEAPYQNKWLVNPAAQQWATTTGLSLVSALTVNEVTTNPKRISQLQQKYQPVVESMEGAALHYVALQEGISFLQLRAISNFVGERNKAYWKIKEAIEALNTALQHVLLSADSLS